MANTSRANESGAQKEPDDTAPSSAVVRSAQLSSRDTVRAFCNICGKPINDGDGRYRIGRIEFHIDCFDRRRRGR